MIDVSEIQTVPTWVVWAVSLVSALLGAGVGGLASYWASYGLEKRKWGASAAILRKDEVYSPVYDELASLVDELESKDGWRLIPKVRALPAWRELSHTSRALGLPRALKLRLDRFVELCDVYVRADRRLFRQIEDALPERHLDQDDYGVAALLVGRMLLGFQRKDYEVIDYMRSQRGPQSPDLLQYWTPDRFAEARTAIENLSGWTSTKQFHDEYVKELYSLREEVGKRIQRIGEKYQPAEPDL